MCRISGSFIFLVINLDFAIGENDVAGVEFPFVAKHRHQARLAAAMKKIGDRRVINRQIRIAVEHKKFFAQQRQRAFDGAAGAQKFWPVEGIIQLDAKLFAVAKSRWIISPR